MRSLQEYREAVRSFAADIVEDVDEQGKDESDELRTTVDGSDWIIYTANALAVLVHTDNDDAAFDDMGDDALAGCTSTAEVYTRLAFYAMCADIAEALDDARGAKEDIE